MKTLSIVTLSSSVISTTFIIEHKDFPLSIIPSVYNSHFFKICIVPKWCDYRQGLTVYNEMKDMNTETCLNLHKSKLLSLNNRVPEKFKQMQVGDFIDILGFRKLGCNHCATYNT